MPSLTHTPIPSGVCAPKNTLPAILIRSLGLDAEFPLKTTSQQRTILGVQDLAKCQQASNLKCHLICRVRFLQQLQVHHMLKTKQSSQDCFGELLLCKGDLSSICGPLVDLNYKRNKDIHQLRCQIPYGFQSQFHLKSIVLFHCCHPVQQKANCCWTVSGTLHSVKVSKRNWKRLTWSGTWRT